MAWLFLKLHATVVWIVWGGLRLAGRSVWSFVLAVLALLGEEVRRYGGLAVWGVLIVGAGKLALHAPAGTRQPLLLTVLLLLGIWALAVRRAAHLTRENNLFKVRQRQAFRELKGDVQQLRIGQRIIEGTATRTRGTRAGRMFKANRDADAQAEADARAAEAQAEAERRQAAADDQRRQDLADREPDPYATQPR